MEFKDICLEVLVEMKGADEIFGRKMRKMSRRGFLQRLKAVGQRKWQGCPRIRAREESDSPESQEAQGDKWKGRVHRLQ